jgi:hypothetical protein
MSMMVAARVARAWGVFALLVPVAVAAERPNILFLFADDWGRDASLLATVDGRPAETLNRATTSGARQRHSTKWFR